MLALPYGAMGAAADPSIDYTKAHAEWLRTIVKAVELQWRIPPSRITGIERPFDCTATVTQTYMMQNYDYEVSDVRIVRSCGNSALDDSLLQAIRSLSTLPATKESGVFQEEVTLRFSEPAEHDNLRTPEEIQLAIDRRKSEIWKIFVSRHLNHAGKIMMSFTIAPSGEVSAATIQTSDFTDRELGDALITFFRSMKFQKKGGDPFTYSNYPLYFGP